MAWYCPGGPGGYDAGERENTMRGRYWSNQTLDWTPYDLAGEGSGMEIVGEDGCYVGGGGMTWPGLGVTDGHSPDPGWRPGDMTGEGPGLG